MPASVAAGVRPRSLLRLLYTFPLQLKTGFAHPGARRSNGVGWQPATVAFLQSNYGLPGRANDPPVNVQIGARLGDFERVEPGGVVG